MVGDVDVQRTGDVVMLVFDRFALGGPAHPLRAIRCGVSWGPRNLWPQDGENGAMGTLVVLPAPAMPSGSR